MQYLNKKYLFIPLLLLIIVVAFLNIRNFLSYGKLDLSGTEPATYIVKPIISDDESITGTLDVANSDTQIKLKTGRYLIDATSNNSANSVYVVEIRGRKTTQLKLEFEEYYGAVAGSGFSPRTMAKPASGYLMAIDGSSGGVYKITSSEEKYVSPFLSSSYQATFSTEHSGTIIDKDLKLKYFDVNLKPITKEVDKNFSKDSGLVYDQKTQKFIIVSNGTIYTYQAGAENVLSAKSIDGVKDNAFSYVAGGGKLLLLAGGDEQVDYGPTEAKTKSNSYLFDIENSEIKTIKHTSGLSATISPDGDKIGIYDSGLLRILDSASLKEIAYTDGGAGDYLWLNNDSFVYAKGGGIWRCQLSEEGGVSKKIIDVGVGTPRNIVEKDGTYYFANTNGQEIVIYRYDSSAIKPDTKNLTFPIRTSEYKIDLNYLFGTKPSLIITTYAIINNPARDAVTFAKQTKSYRKLALNYLKEHGIDTSKFKIIYVPDI